MGEADGGGMGRRRWVRARARARVAAWGGNGQSKGLIGPV